MAPSEAVLYAGQCDESSGLESLDDLARASAKKLTCAERAVTPWDIVHIETGEEQPTGETGEICVRGYLVMTGYYGQPGQQRTA